MENRTAKSESERAFGKCYALCHEGERDAKVWKTWYAGYNVSELACILACCLFALEQAVDIKHQARMPLDCNLVTVAHLPSPVDLINSPFSLSAPSPGQLQEF